MCAVSMIMQFYEDKWQQRLDQFGHSVGIPFSEVTDFKTLIDRAKDYDIKNDQKDCELESKKEAIRKIAKELGIEIPFI